MNSAKNNKPKATPQASSWLANSFKSMGGGLLTSIGFALGVFSILLAVTATVPWVTIGVAAIGSIGLMTTGTYVSKSANHKGEPVKGFLSASKRLEKKLEGMDPKERVEYIQLEEARLEAKAQEKNNTKWTERIAPEEKSTSTWAEKLDKNYQDENADILFEAQRA